MIKWWKIVLFVWIGVFSALGIMTPIAGGLSDLAIFAEVGDTRLIPVAMKIADHDLTEQEDGTFLVAGEDKYGDDAMFVLPEKPAGFSEAEGYLLDARYDKENHRVVAAEILGDYPGWSFPYIPGLGERAKIIFFHVPMSWMTVIAFLVSMWFGIKYLRKKNLIDDAKSAYAAGLGLLFCILATVTGSVWAQFNWGTFWNWDPRETSIFVLLLIYGAYFTLRSAIEVDEKRARLSAVYSILAFVTVPFFIFIMPRILPGLHPGSADDVNAGPVVSSGGMDAGMRVILYSMLLGCIVLFGWLMSIQMRVFRITQKQEADDIAAAEAIS